MADERGSADQGPGSPTHSDHPDDAQSIARHREATSSSPSYSASAFLEGGGTVGAMMREHDWSQSPLGPPDRWPQSLRTVVSLLLNSKFPMFVAWGKDLGFLYNDAYAEILAAKHPRALGARFYDIWSEIWPDIWPLIEGAMAGEASYRENLPLTMNRRGFEEETWFTFSYSPVRDESGGVGGMFCAVEETTAQVLGERHRRAETDRLREMFEQAPSYIAVVRGPDHVFELANAAFHAMVGRQRLVGLSYREALPEIDRQGFTARLDLVRATGKPFVGRSMTAMIERATGPVERVIDFIFQPIRAADGTVSGIFIEGNDITERARADAEVRRFAKELKDSEARYRALFNSLDEGFCALEAVENTYGDVVDFRYVEANPALVGGSGINDVLGKTIGQVLEEEAPGWIEIFRNVLVSGDSIRFERQLKTTDRLLELFAFRVEPASLRQVAVLFQDISERRQIEAKLRASEAQFRNLADAMPQLVWTADADGRVDYYNARQHRYDGIVPRPDGSFDWVGLLHPDDQAHTAEAWSISARTGDPFSCEHRLALRGSGWTWHVSRAECVRDGSGAISRWYGTATDISELKTAQQAVQAANATLEKRIEEALAERRLLADLVEGTDAFVQVADLSYRWLAINKAAANEFERIFGIRPKIGDSMLDILADRPQHQEAVRAVWSRALAGEEFTEVQEFGDPSRDRRSYEMKYNILRDRDGRRIGAYQFSYDVTERLKAEARLSEAEEQLRQSQKMEAIGQLTGGVAHDFNNLLMPIVGALDLLRRRSSGDERTNRLTIGALQAAERARLLVQRLLAFSRRQHLEPRPVDINTLIENMADLLTRSLGPRISLAFELADELPAAHVDPNQLELALLNLAVNGRDAMAGDGRLTISTELTHPPAGSPLVPGSYIRLAITDNGTGMDEETLRRATEPFFTTKGVGRGTGLGLSSVHGLAEQSGGEFRLESKPGHGTTALLWLPVSQQTSIASSIGTEPSIVISKANGTPLLLVDDEALVRAGTADMLKDEGYEVTDVSSGFEALRLLREGLEVKLLVTDFAMPGMTGVELAREALGIQPDLQVLLITGYADVSDPEAEGLMRLAKPYKQSDLAAALAQLLSRKNVVTLLRDAGGIAPKS